MKLLYVLLIIVATFLLAFVTSLLLDWQWIQNEFIRSGLVYLIIVMEMVFGYMITKELLYDK